MTGQGISTSHDEGTSGLRLARSRYSCMCSEQVLARFLEETIEEGKSLQEENAELAVDARPKQPNMSLCKWLRSYLKRNNRVDVLSFEESHIVGPLPAIIDLTPAAEKNPWVTGSGFPPRLIFVRPCAIISPTQESLNPESENIGIHHTRVRSLANKDYVSSNHRAQSGSSKKRLTSIADEMLQDILGELPCNVEDKPSQKSLWKQLQILCKRKNSSTVKAEVQR
ncbi:hypothetical protein DPEC_G00090660 [Dallia pectoralis]|uniref:Uncharacterized protein n=1 Tax=Dallia pectoralis TaxID=75939 RepID=A0ACC2H1A7_DALPE|nr:hypothetical protein DPEC_G00090660 [Dallia pectoralis]